MMNSYPRPGNKILFAYIKLPIAELLYIKPFVFLCPKIFKPEKNGPEKRKSGSNGV
jgi:hypothetical protein